MANRFLTDAELQRASDLLDEIRARLAKLSGADPELLFAYRRKIAKELGYDERSKPAVRKKLKILQRQRQSNLCAVCKKSLPESYAVLDRFVASKGYTEANTRLICQNCDTKTQAARGYK